ncbi:MAG TPA: ABC transporter substrate-binding protein [Azospirillaceae bacterium]|nr:ABC transporter substrate-binding protein [Azospirillaceae bacterium]
MSIRTAASRPVARLASALLLGAAVLSAGAAQAAEVVVRAGYIPVLGAAQAFIIDKQGWDKEAGFDLQLTQFDSGPNMIQALASGTLEGYVAGVGPLIVARAQGIGVRVVASTAVEELVVAAGPDLAAAAKGGNAAKAIADLSAKLGRPVKLATQPAGSIPNTVLQYWLWRVAGVDKSKVELVPMGIDATQQALLAGAVDGATVREPALTIIRDRLPAVSVLAYGKDMIENQPGTVVGVSEELATKHPEVVQKLVDLTVRATKLIQQDPATAAKAVEQVLGRGLIDAKTMQRALTSPASRFSVDPRSIVEKTKLIQDFQVEIGVLKKAEPVDGLFDASFFDKSPKG